jgi:hypothetical protein
MKIRIAVWIVLVLVALVASMGRSMPPQGSGLLPRSCAESTEFYCDAYPFGDRNPKTDTEWWHKQ